MMKKIMITLLLIVMSVSLFAGCDAAKTEDESAVPVAYSLYCGLNDADTGTQIVPTEEAVKIARKVITDKGFGYTEHIAYGAYTEADRSIENVKIIGKIFKFPIDKLLLVCYNLIVSKSEIIKSCFMLHKTGEDAFASSRERAFIAERI